MILIRIWSDNNPIWWRHQMETVSALLAICAGNSPVTGHPHKGQWHGALMFEVRWYETQSRPLWRKCNESIRGRLQENLFRYIITEATYVFTYFVIINFLSRIMSSVYVYKQTIIVFITFQFFSQGLDNGMSCWPIHFRWSMRDYGLQYPVMVGVSGVTGNVRLY